MDNWRKFRRLRAGERGLLLRALLLLPLTAMALRLVGLRRWQSAVARLLAPGPASRERWPEAALERARLTARMVQAAERHGLGRPNCLAESLVLLWLLRRQGIASELRIGVRKQGDRLEAHAWVEHCGKVLNDLGGVHRHYAPFHGSIAAATPEPR